MRISSIAGLILLVMGACADAAESPLAGTWNCANIPDTGAQNSWNLIIRSDNDALTGTLTDGEVEIPVLNIKLKDTTLTFNFSLKDTPYEFKGTFQPGSFEGKYSGDESGTLRCQKP
ncbi:MAG TPA: hypothetical protein VFA04_06875 [Bryobacteraceae bacterium]|nr:hypothetical protein [Bryobacteraceae bacterium]